MTFNKAIHLRTSWATTFTPQGVNFDGTDWLTLGAGLTGAVDGKVGICSFWHRATGDNNNYHMILEDDSFANVQVMRDADNTFRFNMSNPSLLMSTTSTFVAGGAWKHILAAWDVGNAFAKVYVNDVDDTAASPVITDANIDYTRTNFSVGARLGGISNILVGDIAEFYFNSAEFLDITNSTNRRKFIDAGGAPVDLGANGSTPTGTQPIIYLHNPTASWHTNLGSGGSFTVTGALTDSATNPP